jgi:hypothetical protein
LCELRGVEQRLSVRRVPDLALGVPEADQQVAALGALPVGCLVVELERAAIPARRLVRGEPGRRMLGGSPCVVKRLGGVAAEDRRGPVAGELTQPLARFVPTLLLQRLRYLAVKHRATGAPEILVKRVLDERVPWLNRIEAQFRALRYFTLAGTDHPDHATQARLIRRYIHWRNRNTDNPRLKRLINTANVA